MADYKRATIEADELRPLRSMIGRSELPAAARCLGQALQELADQPLPPPPAADWAVIEEQAMSLARRRRWRYHLSEVWRGLGPMPLGLCAASLAIIILLGTLGARSLSATGPGHGRRVLGTEATALAVATDAREHLQLVATKVAAVTTLRCGAQLQVAEGDTDIDQAEPYRPRINLRHGRVSVSVPPMPTGGRLVVATNDAEVIVHGTRFTVTRHETEDATAVSVQEGLVEVRPLGGRRSAVFVRPGEEVVVPSGAAYFRQLVVQVSEMIDASRCDDQASSVLAAYLDTAAPTLDVSEAQYLMGSCAAAKGDLATALTSFERVAVSSGSPLRAENALARSAQLRAAANAADGALAWQRYLDRYPQGQHRESAQRYLRELMGQRTPN